MRREERVAAEPGRGDTGITRRADFPSRPSSASSVPWLDRAWAAQGTWGGGGCRAGGLGTAGSRVSRYAGREVGQRTSAGGGIVLSAVVLKVSASLLQAATRICTRISFRGGGGGGGVMI